MDKPMRFAFKNIIHLDIDNCVQVTGGISGKVITIDDVATPLREFIKKRTRLVTIDMFPSEGIVPLLPDNPERYISMIRKYALIEQDDTKFGYIDEVYAYNGFPNILDPKEFVDNPVTEYKKTITKIGQRIKNGLILEDLLIPGQMYMRTDVFFLKEYFSKIQQILPEPNQGTDIVSN